MEVVVYDMDKNMELETLPEGLAHGKHSPNVFHVLTHSFLTQNVLEPVSVLAAGQMEKPKNRETLFSKVTQLLDMQSRFRCMATSLFRLS